MVVVTAIRFSLWFELNIDSLHIDEEGFDSVTGNFSHTVG